MGAKRFAIQALLGAKQQQQQQPNASAVWSQGSEGISSPPAPRLSPSRTRKLGPGHFRARTKGLVWEWRIFHFSLAPEVFCPSPPSTETLVLLAALLLLPHKARGGDSNDSIERQGFSAIQLNPVSLSHLPIPLPQ